MQNKSLLVYWVWLLKFNMEVNADVGTDVICHDDAAIEIQKMLRRCCRHINKAETLSRRCWFAFIIWSDWMSDPDSAFQFAWFLLCFLPDCSFMTLLASLILTHPSCLILTLTAQSSACMFSLIGWLIGYGEKLEHPEKTPHKHGKNMQISTCSPLKKSWIKCLWQWRRCSRCGGADEKFRLNWFYVSENVL